MSYRLQVPGIAQAGKTCADELSHIAQAGKICADELLPIAQAGKACIDELSPIGHPGKTRCETCIIAAKSHPPGQVRTYHMNDMGVWMRLDGYCSAGAGRRAEPSLLLGVRLRAVLLESHTVLVHDPPGRRFSGYRTPPIPV